jgi:Fe-S-cluster containining protein
VIKDLHELHVEIDKLYKDIIRVCSSCKDHDCEGYIWLIPSEVQVLCKTGAEVVEINDNCCFLNPFDNPRPEDFEQMKPKCRLRKKGLCSIYENRPFVCRIYPVGFFSGSDGEIQLVVHLDCEFIRGMEKERLEAFCSAVAEVFDNLSDELRDGIATTYSAVDEISKYPDGPNNHTIIQVFAKTNAAK